MCKQPLVESTIGHTENREHALTGTLSDVSLAGGRVGANMTHLAGGLGRGTYCASDLTIGVN